ncbi:hypothetical protein NQ314_018209 [Rhamnusium bicolor]|uniref:Uncharacterized protein n=1 Tax=Rhamnusium bicolor TaxID=1586634 RepID=A0AAV8WQY2_9CUCU|nr:hypothetical protein NQ314_018209 [Rhamnusium bicolor]
MSMFSRSDKRDPPPEIQLSPQRQQVLPKAAEERSRLHRGPLCGKSEVPSDRHAGEKPRSDASGHSRSVEK